MPKKEILCNLFTAGILLIFNFLLKEVELKPLIVKKPLSNINLNIKGWKKEPKFLENFKKNTPLTLTYSFSGLYKKGKDEFLLVIELVDKALYKKGIIYGAHIPDACYYVFGYDTVESSILNLSVDSLGKVPINYGFYKRGNQKVVVLWWYHPLKFHSSDILRNKFHLLKEKLLHQHSFYIMVKMYLPVRGVSFKETRDSVIPVVKNIIAYLENFISLYFE